MGRSERELRLGIVQGLTSRKHTSLGGSRTTYVSDLFVGKGYRVLEKWQSGISVMNVNSFLTEKI